MKSTALPVLTIVLGVLIYLLTRWSLWRGHCRGGDVVLDRHHRGHRRLWADH